MSWPIISSSPGWGASETAAPPMERMVPSGQRPDATDPGEGLVPRTGHIAVGCGVVAHRMRQASGLFERMVRPSPQLGHGVGGEDVGAPAIVAEVPYRCLGTVLAELEEMRVRWLRPGAGGAHVTAGLVLAHQRLDDAGARACLPGRSPLWTPSSRMHVRSGAYPAAARPRCGRPWSFSSLVGSNTPGERWFPPERRGNASRFSAALRPVLCARHRVWAVPERVLPRSARSAVLQAAFEA